MIYKDKLQKFTIFIIHQSSWWSILTIFSSPWFMVVLEWMYDTLPLLRNHTFTAISSDVIDRLMKSRLTSLEASIWILCVCFLHISLCPSTREIGSVSKLPTPRAKCWPALSRYVISRRCHWLAFSYPLNCPFSSGLFFPSPAIITIW